MKLFYSNTSPYSRKVRVLIYEKNLSSQVSSFLCNPFDKVPELEVINPLHQIPTLLLNDNTPLYDSPVICEYLDSLGGDHFIPPFGPDRWAVLRWQALCDGILDAAYNMVMEQRRETQQQSPHWLRQWQEQIQQAFRYIENTLDTLPTQMSIAQISLGCSLAYLDFRLPNLNWHHQHPALDQWFNDFSVRESMLKTQPK